MVTAAGLGALVLVIRGLSGPGLSAPAWWAWPGTHCSGSSPRSPWWAKLRPIVTPGEAASDAGNAALTFCFAALLFWGLPVAVLLRAITTIIVALSGRQALFRAAFNVAQFTLSLCAAAAVLSLGGVHPPPLRPRVPAGAALGTIALAAAAYFAVNFVCVGVAVALHARAPVRVMLRKALPYQAFVNFTLLSTAPLVAVVMSRSVLLVLLFLLPLIAIYANAAMSVKREYQALHDQLTSLPNRSCCCARRRRQSPERPGPAPWPASSCWTWTGSRRSMTRSATCPGMGCCRSSPTG